MDYLYILISEYKFFRLASRDRIILIPVISFMIWYNKIFDIISTEIFISDLQVILQKYVCRKKSINRARNMILLSNIEKFNKKNISGNKNTSVMRMNIV